MQKLLEIKCKNNEDDLRTGTEAANTDRRPILKQQLTAFFIFRMHCIC